MQGNTPEKGTEIKVPVRNFLMIKRLEDDENKEGGVRLVGTIVQYVLHDGKIASVNKIDADKLSKYFNYRINDRSCDGDKTLTARRMEDPNPNIWRTTFQAHIPLKIMVEEEYFPFKIIRATAGIELSSGADGDTRIRPNLVLANTENIRSNVNISGVDRRGNIDTNVEDTLDGMVKYDLLTPYPEVVYKYDKEKGYCPVYAVTFHLTVNGNEKFVRTLLPLILVSALNTLYLWNDEYNDENDVSDKQNVKDLLGFTSTLALTVVFLFENIYDPAGNKAKLPDILYVLFIFVSLILSAIPSTAWRIVGAALFWCSFFFPISNYLRIKWKMHKKRPQKGTNKLFVKDDDYKQLDDFQDDVFVRLEPDAEDKKELKAGTKEKFDPNVFDFDKDDKTIFIKYPKAML